MTAICIIAEHDPWDIRLLRIYADKVGFQMVQALESQDVPPLARQEQPSVILLESDLPGTLRPQEVLWRLQQDHATCHVPVLIFSWFDTLAAREAIPGAAGYLQKPVTYEAFLAALAEAGVS